MVYGEINDRDYYNNHILMDTRERRLNIKQLQKEVHNNTINLGYKVNKKTTLKKLREELKEFSKSTEIAYDSSDWIKNIDGDKYFLERFEKHIKDSEHDEIPDLFFVLLSYCQHKGIDFETLVLNKLRYNKLRG